MSLADVDHAKVSESPNDAIDVTVLVYSRTSIYVYYVSHRTSYDINILYILIHIKHIFNMHNMII